MVSWWKGKLPLTSEHEISYGKFAILHEETGFQLIHLIFYLLHLKWSLVPMQIEKCK